MNPLKAFLIAASLALPSLFTASAWALPNCGTCKVGGQPASHTFVTAATVCTTCHNTPAKPATPATPAVPGKPTVPAMPATPATPAQQATGRISLHPTTVSCGACVVGTAPSSVSAHRNVNAAMIACSACHGSVANGATHGRHIDDARDEHDGSDNHTQRTDSPGNSAFGHSHKRSHHHDHDNERD